MKNNSLMKFGGIVMAVTAIFYFAMNTNQAVDAKSKMKVAFVYLTNPGDHGWTYAHEVGRQQVEEHFGDAVETVYVENVPEGPDATRVIRELAQNGNDMIFTTSFGYMEPTLKVAKDFPNIKFDHITGYMRADNMATGNIRFYEGRYVQGVVAGLTTKSDKIGYVAAFPIPEVIQGINSFAQGLRSVNKDAAISVVWANTWYDPVKEGDAAKVLLRKVRIFWHNIQIVLQCFKLLKKLAYMALDNPLICMILRQMLSSLHLLITGVRTIFHKLKRQWMIHGAQERVQTIGPEILGRVLAMTSLF